jgi:hypothetical protein
MDSYIKLIDKLNSLDLKIKSCVEINNSDLKTLFKNPCLLNLLVYRYDIHTDKFRLTSSEFGYESFNNTNLKKFLANIGPSFRKYFIDFFASYVNFLIENMDKDSIVKYTLQSFLPIKLKYNEYFFTALYVIPEFENKEVIGLCFILLPLKEYNNEVISIKILKDFEKNNRITSILWGEIQLEKILTEEQTKIAQLLLNHYSSKEIAVKLNKKHDNILKYNIRIKDRLSTFFNIEFDNAKDAVNYYKSCFLVN